MDKIRKVIDRIDSWPLWWTGIILEIIVFIPYLVMGETSVFPWHDQLDENILHYVLTARHIADGTNIIPEMLSGVSGSALQPFGILFLPLYMVFSPYVAFVVQYAIVFAIAFMGMYFLLKRCTGSSIISVIVAGFYAMLPFWPVYGAACAGIPLVLFGIISLYRRENLPGAYLSIALFVLTSHVVFTGYSVLGFWGLFLVLQLFRKRLNKESVIGFIASVLLYSVINYEMIMEVLFGVGDYVSHRAEFVNSSFPFFQAFKDVFISSGMGGESYHKMLIIPIVLCLILRIIIPVRGDGEEEQQARRELARALWLMGSLILIALLYALFKSELYIAWKNRQDGFMHYFQIDRFYWLYPGLWWLEAGLCIRLWWRDSTRYKYICGTVALIGVLLPSFRYVLDNSYFYMSINQLNNGSNITGYIDWESYYSEDVMADIERAIGKDMDSYRVVHIGMNPTPALMHGFYTLDGYANSYPLEYKHEFRKIMATELEKAHETAIYYDTWGSRCYLFNSQSGNSFMNGKNSRVEYSGLQYDFGRLYDMGCRYIFSCGQIKDHEESGLKYVGDFSSDTSYWSVWVYELRHGGCGDDMVCE